MRNWLNGNDPDAPVPTTAADDHHKDNKHHLKEKIVDAWKENRKPGGGRRVAVVHCKAGKGRSGTVACCYLITECGWTPEEALARFTERRMRPRMGPGVSIPSQLRTVAYAERWARGGDDGAGRRRYVDRAVEILEIHVWGLHNGVKLAVEGYVDQGKKIRIFHTFTKKERYIVEGDPPSAGGGGGVVGMLYDMAGYGSAATPVPEQEVLDDARGGGRENADASPVVSPPDRSDTGTPSSMKSTKAKMGKRASKLISKVSRSSSRAQTPKPPADPDAKSPSTDPTGNESADSSPTSITSSALSIDRERQNQGSGDDSSSPANGNTDAETEPGGRAVIFKPRTTIRVPNSDVNITVERRNRAPSSMGLTMVTAVAHVWFNAYFEGRGPEQAGVPDDAGVFEIDWDKMDGIKGSSQKGTRAADRIAVVWRAVGPAGDDDEEAVPAPSPAGKVGVDRDEQPKEEKKEQETSNTPPSAEPDPEPEAGAAIPQMRPADWQGGEQTEQPPDAAERGLGLRTKSPDSADVSQASSIRAGDGDAVSELDVGGGGGVEEDGEEEDDDFRRVRSDVGLDGAAGGGADRGGRRGHRCRFGCRLITGFTGDHTPTDHRCQHQRDNGDNGRHRFLVARSTLHGKTFY